MNQVIRIIGGTYRGKKISFPATEGLRPTPNRVKETVFNWLMHDIRDAVCLDAFAGSGSLGFEAFSRGAAHVTLIEQSPLVYRHLQQQTHAFQSNKLRALHADITTFLATTTQQFDLVFFDPPFTKKIFFEQTMHQHIARILKPEGILYFEAPHEMHLHPTSWECLKSKKTGLVFYSLHRKLAR